MKIRMPRITHVTDEAQKNIGSIKCISKICLHLFSASTYLIFDLENLFTLLRPKQTQNQKYSFKKEFFQQNNLNHDSLTVVLQAFFSMYHLLV